MWNISHRSGNLLAFVACAAMMGYALYAQHVLGLIPCPLCVFQRMSLIALGIVLLIAAVHNPAAWGRRIYAFLVILAAGTGAGVAGRHVWLQSLPPEQVPSCGPGFDYIMESFPLADALGVIFSGSGECAEVQWLFLGLSLPTWVLINFVLIGGFGVAWNWNRSRA